MVVWLLNAAIVAGVFRNELMVLGVVAALVARGLLLDTRRALAWGALAAACGLIGMAGAARVRNDGAHVAAVAARNGAALTRLEGRVASFPAASPFGTSFLFETRLDGRRVRLATRAAFFDVDYGDAFACRARVAVRADDDYLVAHGAAGTARVRLRDTEPSAGPAAVSPGRLFWPLHRAARARLCRAMANDAALPLGLMLGERGYLDRRVREAVIRLGIAHLLALSGMHLTVVAMIAVVLARSLARGRDLLVLIALTGYVGMVGDVESLTRAYLMAVLLVLARALARPLRPVDALGKALFLMLLASPVSVLSVGLQLSFAATLAVLVAVERIPLLRAGERGEARGARRLARRAVTALAGAFVVSVAVEIVIAPLQFHHFGQVSVVGPLATALFVIPVTVVQVLAMVTTALIGVPLLGDAAVTCLAAASRAVVAAVLAAAAATPDPLTATGPRAPLYYWALLTVWRFPRRRAAWAGAALLLAAALVAR